MSEIDYSSRIEQAVSHIKNHIQFNPQVGVILGTGLGRLIDDIEIEGELNYADIPHFPVSTVESHSGKLIFGKINGKSIVAMKGRFHYYEGYDMKEVTFPVRVMKQLGVSCLIVSNAAGGLNPSYKIGEVMILNDHIDLFPENPLRGKNLDQFGVRFPDMSEPYSFELIEKAKKIAQVEGVMAHEGVYAGVQGPNLETKAEYKYLRTIGADAVGMSTIPEVIVARHMELPTFAISAITDLCSPGNIKKVSIAEVLAAAAKAEPGMALIIKKLIGQLP
ncbi:purine-nucleoside phosphorylase [Litoribacter alkaliphilus]|uniref:Purine nucleoside phosphorylase n=1 Tax=Litoribacter ruber TaxID=702568 RepID=A0AAP2G1D2_9BACT|nr:purine-nucleoside phosphorylase [Litoribacter alkaliphilus]MBS9523957.1 purine-nucleoside phosphorylase [Litoribacter alkaliphilus]